MAARNNPSLVGRQPSQGPPPVRVLVVDDSETFRRMAAEVIAVAPGFALAGTAASGEEAIDVVVGQRPDLVLMDVRMPGIGGIEAARRIADAGAGVHVVLMSADPSLAEAERLPHGTSGVVRKDRLSPAALRALWARLGGGSPGARRRAQGRQPRPAPSRPVTEEPRA
jgi:two-component system, NarL family, invasion response regulator UvrY